MTFKLQRFTKCRSKTQFSRGLHQGTLPSEYARAAFSSVARRVHIISPKWTVRHVPAEEEPVFLEVDPARNRAFAKESNLGFYEKWFELCRL